MAKVAKKINIITLGCSKNVVDSEQFAVQASIAGFEVVHNSDEIDFNIAVVNTCGFINDAKEESINMIFQLVILKNSGKLEKIIVFGCLAQRYMNELKAEIPEVDVFCGNYNLKELLNLIDADFNETHKHDRILDSPGHYAYLKIAEGCNRKCAFCAIPLIKGNYVSRPKTDIIEEAQMLASKGVKELIIIAQDISYYGYDIDKKLHLPELVEELSKIEDIKWIRLHYLYPFLFPENLLDIIANNPKVCNYIDIPLQHISDNVLKAMNRGATKKQTLDLLTKMRKKLPDATFRTTMLVGHPTETDEDFNELLEFVKEVKFDKLGVFTYSEEEGTSAAKNYNDDISEDVKNSRADILMDTQREISLSLNSLKLNKTLRVIVDEFDGEMYYGRSQYDSVEVDGEVVFTSDTELFAGDFCDVIITAFDEYDLFGEKK
ncbi:MAG: 30S ribosomal protein S12 methylthiotransferase RimO [Bacteroidales bacterium]|nr:30S ribosomal protein S12 methylthiotransferase RimO [Bacteroidales bacterium]